MSHFTYNVAQDLYFHQMWDYWLTLIQQSSAQVWVHSFIYFASPNQKLFQPHTLAPLLAHFHQPDIPPSLYIVRQTFVTRSQSLLPSTLIPSLMHNGALFPPLSVKVVVALLFHIASRKTFVYPIFYKMKSFELGLMVFTLSHREKSFPR